MRRSRRDQLDHAQGVTLTALGEARRAARQVAARPLPPPPPLGAVPGLVAQALVRFADPPGRPAFDPGRDADRALGIRGEQIAPRRPDRDDDLAARVEAAEQIGLVYACRRRTPVAVLHEGIGSRATGMIHLLSPMLEQAGARAVLVLAPPDWLHLLEALAPPGWLAILCPTRPQRALLRVRLGPRPVRVEPPEGWSPVLHVADQALAWQSPAGDALLVDLDDVATSPRHDSLLSLAVEAALAGDALRHRPQAAPQWAAAYAAARETVQAAALLSAGLEDEEQAAQERYLRARGHAHRKTTAAQALLELRYRRRRLAAARIERLPYARRDLLALPGAICAVIVPPTGARPHGLVDLTCATRPMSADAGGSTVRLLLPLDGGDGPYVRHPEVPDGARPTESDDPIDLGPATLPYVEAIESDRCADAARIAAGRLEAG